MVKVLQPHFILLKVRRVKLKSQMKPELRLLEKMLVVWYSKWVNMVPRKVLGDPPPPLLQVHCSRRRHADSDFQHRGL